MFKRKFYIPDNKIPKKWYNIASDLPEALPAVLHPLTRVPITPEDLSPLFPMEIIKQEVSTERFIDIPEPVLDVYSLSRPSPLIRAYNLEKALDTPAKIYYKYEGVNPAGSHKVNTAVAQAFYNKSEGIKRLTTETGAGQWGSALSFAGALFNLEIDVYMVRVSYNQKPYRRALIESYGGTVTASPSSRTEAGRKILAENPNNSGSLGIAISEAVEMAVQRDDTKYSLGSVLNHVLLHQTIIGNEALIQFDLADDYPDIVIACAGGGSNFGGFAFPFIGEMLRGGKSVKSIAVEPFACPTLTKGVYEYDYGDTAHLTPLMKMYTLGNGFIPSSIHAGGLRYHGMSPIISLLKKLNLIDAVSQKQVDCFEAGIKFARTEGILPAPESTHAIKTAIDEALKCKEEGISRTIAFNLSGHGHFDMSAYSDYLNGNMSNND
ncbi:MAG: TrpB-like pyridoxal phosphate-dependent enzyme [Bacteroidota bacterium]|nr:TrpB-like pyridoxal phosphate-dependent enzyme [Bacteroidota bacterium]